MSPKEARNLIAAGRVTEALALTTAGVSAEQAEAWLPAHADALKAAGRMDEALAATRRAAEMRPTSAVRRHNLAAMLGDLGHAEEAEREAEAALALGGDAPETWLVLARARQARNDLDRADQAYGAALTRRPDYEEALRERAQLVWMRTGDLGRALSTLASLPSEAGARRAVEAAVLDAAGDPEGALESLLRGAVTAPLALQAVSLAAKVRPPLALSTAETLLAQAGPLPPVLFALAEARIAVGEPAGAAQAAETGLAASPDDQYGLALLATAWRMLGDDRYRELYDYDGLTSAEMLDTPQGWPSLSAYLDDLAEALHRRHAFSAHPLHQSLRGGSQASIALLGDMDPAIAAFGAAIDGPIRRHIERCGPGFDPFRRRRSEGYRLAGIWSVRLTAGGRHVDHVHPKGWMSSACYIDLPSAIGNEAREGWLRLGRPPLHGERFQAERWIRPQRGMLALFPSYMWHGVEAFSEGRRLTIAFDVVPA